MKKIATTSNSTSSNNSNNQTTNMKNQNTAAPKKVFSYERKSVTPASLEIHPLLVAVNTTINSNIFVDFYKEFNYIEIPVVTEDGFVITHAADVLGAQDLGLESIEVVLMKNATQDDVIRFISFKDIISHGKNRTAISQTIKYLTNFLKNTDSGKQLAAEFDSNKTRTILCEMMDISTGTHQTIAKIEKHAPELLPKIDKGEITSAEAIKIINKAIPFVSRKRYDGLVCNNIASFSASKTKSK